MSIPKQDKQATFFDATFLAQDLFDATDRFEIFRREVQPALEAMRDELCQLYCLENGRPGLEPVLMAGVTLLQFMERVPDRKATENVRLHLGWELKVSGTFSGGLWIYDLLLLFFASSVSPWCQDRRSSAFISGSGGIPGVRYEWHEDKA